MEKTNWIEKIKKFVHKAMDKGLKVRGSNISGYYFNVYDNKNEMRIYFVNGEMEIKSEKGGFTIDSPLNDRDILELETLVIDIKEYNEAMAILEFDSYFNNKEEKEEITDINNLDDDD